MQKHVDLVALVKSFPTSFQLQNLASVEPRMNPLELLQCELAPHARDVLAALGEARTVGCAGCAHPAAPFAKEKRKKKKAD